MKSVVSVRGQTVVPKEVREALGIKPGTRLSWSVKNGTVVVQPLPEDPIGALKGAYGRLQTSDDLLAERRKERDEDESGLEEMKNAWRAS